jgi:Delta7-sterol 5-desaturase
MDFPELSFSLTFLVLVAIMLIRYFTLAGTFYILCQYCGTPPISSMKKNASQNLRDIKWSVISSVIFALGGAVLIFLWRSGHTKIYFEISSYGFIYFFLSLPMLMIVHDMYFYWTHRILHLKPFFKRFHLVHHESKIPTAWTSFAFHPVEALIQALILPLMMIFIPVHGIVLLSFLVLMTLFGLLNHIGYEYYPKFMESKFRFITASHHQFHHLQAQKNYGLYFTWWDIWMGTEGERK